MDEHALTINTIRDGPVCSLILRGDLDLFEIAGFLEHAARVIDDQTERLVLDLAGVTFLDCAGVRALMIATRLAPAGCPVIIRSLSPEVSRVLELLGLDLESIREPVPGQELPNGLWDRAISQQELAPVEPGELDLDA